MWLIEKCVHLGVRRSFKSSSRWQEHLQLSWEKIPQHKLRYSGSLQIHKWTVRAVMAIAPWADGCHDISLCLFQYVQCWNDEIPVACLMIPVSELKEKLLHIYILPSPKCCSIFGNVAQWPESAFGIVCCETDALAGIYTWKLVSCRCLYWGKGSPARISAATPSSLW